MTAANPRRVNRRLISFLCVAGLALLPASLAAKPNAKPAAKAPASAKKAPEKFLVFLGFEARNGMWLRLDKSGAADATGRFFTYLYVDDWNGVELNDSDELSLRSYDDHFLHLSGGAVSATAGAPDRFTIVKLNGNPGDVLQEGDQVVLLHSSGQLLLADRSGVLSMTPAKSDYYGVFRLHRYTRGSQATRKQLAEALRIRDYDKQPEKALPLLEAAWAAGAADAAYELGLCYVDGKGVPKDLSAALPWFRRGAEAGDTGSMLMLATCLQAGNGVASDKQAALLWYQRYLALVHMPYVEPRVRALEDELWSSSGGTTVTGPAGLFQTRLPSGYGAANSPHNYLNGNNVLVLQGQESGLTAEPVVQMMLEKGGRTKEPRVVAGHPAQLVRYTENGRQIWQLVLSRLNQLAILSWSGTDTAEGERCLAQVCRTFRWLK